MVEVMPSVTQLSGDNGLDSGGARERLREVHVLNRTDSRHAGFTNPLTVFFPEKRKGAQFETQDRNGIECVVIANILL